MRGINPGVQSALNAPLPQTTTTQPNPLQVLSQIMTQRPDLIQQAVPSVQAQTMLGQAGKSPWMETPRGGMQTNTVTGERIENPFISTAQNRFGLDINNDYDLALMVNSPDPEIRARGEQLAQTINDVRSGRFQKNQEILTKEWWKRPNYPIVQTSEGLQPYSPKTKKLEPVIAKPPPTADMRNRVEAKKLVATSIDAVKEYSDKVINKIGVAQRADAIKRGAEAVLGHDPDFRVYEDARMALAGNLAVAQQGSRPSDADIKAIWLPLVPDAFRDTRESKDKKWELIKKMSLPGTVEGGEKTEENKIDDPLGILK
jgi:hypothetical protein